MKKRYFIAPANDAEAKEIISLLREAEEEVLVTEQAWGASWEGLEEDIKAQLAQLTDCTIYGIELQGENPYGAINIDHHCYDGDDRTNDLSSIEQAAEIVGVELSTLQQFVAANDKGFIPSMETLGDTLGLSAADTARYIQEVRALDRSAQGITPEQEEQAVVAIESMSRQGSLTVVELPHSKCATITDRLYGQYEDLLILCGDGEVDFFGSAKTIAELNEAFPGGWSGGQLSEGTGFWGGYPDHAAVRMFFELV